MVTGVPVLAGDLTDTLAASTLRLLLVAVAVMALVLALLFRARLRLLPLGLALCSVAIVFGGLALLGLPLTMASIAVLPVLLGLAVDYAIQYQARARSVGSIATAALATAVGFLVLLLVAGADGARLRGAAGGRCRRVAAGRGDGGHRPVLVLAARRRSGALARSLRGAGDLVDGARRRRARGAPACAARRAHAGAGRAPPRPRARVAGVLAVCGWALDSRIAVVSDLPRLVPQDLAAVRDLDALQRDTGVAGEIDVLVEGEDLTDPKVIAWMRDYQRGAADAARVQRAEGLRGR